jgi:hypothetical protein
LSFIDYSLLSIALFLEFVFFGALVYIKLTKPVTKRDGLTFPKSEELFQKWHAKARKLEKALKPLALHIVALSALAVWVIYRVVLSFL